MARYLKSFLTQRYAPHVWFFLNNWYFSIVLKLLSKWMKIAPRKCLVIIFQLSFFMLLFWFGLCLYVAETEPTFHSVQLLSVRACIRHSLNTLNFQANIVWSSRFYEDYWKKKAGENCVGNIHRIKTVRIRSFSGSYFPAFGLNMEI